MTKTKKLLAIMLSVLVLIASMPFMAVSAGGDEYVLTVDTPYNMWISNSGEIVRFSPEKDGWYKFYSTGEYDTYATLFNSTYEELRYADDSDEDMNFEFKIKLYSGYTYYLEVMAYGLEDEDTAKFDLYVTETAGAESLTITKEPDRTTVIEGFEAETMDCRGLEAEFTLTDGTTVNWSYNEDEKVAGSFVDISQGNDGAGHFYIDITCDEAFERYFFTTIENPVDYFEYSGTTFEYYEGTGGYYDDFDEQYYYYYHFPDDEKLTVYYKDGTNETFDFHGNILGAFVNIVDTQSTTPWVVGSNNFITLELLGKTTDVPVTILPVPFVNVTVDSAPTRDYVFGDRVFGEMDEGTYKFSPNDLTDLAFTVEYSDGTKKTYTDADIDMDNGMIDDYIYTIKDIECTATGAYEVTLNYKGYDIKYNVDVVDSPIADIEVTKAPDRIDFEDDYYPLLYGMEVKVTYTDGTYETVTLTEENVEYFLDGELIYVVKFGDKALYIYDCYDSVEETFYSSVTCLGVKDDFYGLNYTATRDVESITAEKMSANGDGAVLNVEYKNGDKETITFETIAIYDYGYGDYEGYAMTDDGILYYSVYADYDGGEVVGYDCYTLGFDFYVDKATTPEPEKPTEPTEPATETTAPTETTESTETTVTDPTETTESTETTVTDPTETTESTETTVADPTETTESTETTVTDPTETTKATEATTTEPAKTTNTTETTPGTDSSDPVVDKGILGDVDGNGKVNIKDATMIQKAVAKIISLTDSEQIRADVNTDTKVNIKDATAIQKFVAKIETGYPIGKPI